MELKIIRLPMDNGRNRMFFGCFYHNAGCVQKEYLCPLVSDCNPKITYSEKGYPPNKIVKCNNYLCEAK